MKTIILDAGHGGMLNGKYTTAPAKMFKFPNGEIAYEGVINRKFTKRIGEILKSQGFNIVYTVDPSDPTDLSLFKRVEITKKYKSTEAIFVSIHCNAFNSRANGTEIFTTKGFTKSDVLADNIIEEVNVKCPELAMRWDMSDGDKDKEEQFYVIHKTPLYAVLLECLFFDEWENYKLTKNDEFVERFSLSVADGIKKFIKNYK